MWPTYLLLSAFFILPAYWGTRTANPAASWDLFYHLGGNGPWVPLINGAITQDILPPPGCSVQQVHMMSRHAERYPTSNAGNRMLELLKRIEALNVTFKGDLVFLNNWRYFAQDPSSAHNQLTNTSPYAGSLSAFRTGIKLRSRYPHLLQRRGDGAKTNFWASDSERVIETAKYFATALWGLDWFENHSQLHVIPETSDLGADTLTPGDTCLAYRDDAKYGHDYGYRQMFKFRDTYLPAIAKSLRNSNPSTDFTSSEIFSMQEMCGFETLVRGSSPWCKVFTHEDWLNFEYARDVIHFYRAGPGNEYSGAMGWLWLNATTSLLEQGPDVGEAFFSFVHDGDILPMLSALGLFSTAKLPVTHRLNSREWHTSQIVPMGGRAIFELLSCGGTHDKHSLHEKVFLPPAQVQQRVLGNQRRQKRDSGRYVRININDGIVALPGCDSGVGSSCPLAEFIRHVQRRGQEIGDFREVCGLSKDAAEKITFLHQ